MSFELELENNQKFALPTNCPKCKKKTKITRFMKVKFAVDIEKIRMCEFCRKFFVFPGFTVEVVQ